MNKPSYMIADLSSAGKAHQSKLCRLDSNSWEPERRPTAGTAGAPKRIPRWLQKCRKPPKGAQEASKMTNARPR
eukprot:2047756-Pyramimonas_sp.AAC.1